MTEAQYQRLSKTMQKGKTHFVVWRGVVLMGTILFFTGIVMRYVHDGALFRGNVVALLIIDPIMGFCWGLGMWRIFKWKMRRHEETALSNR